MRCTRDPTFPTPVIHDFKMDTGGFAQFFQRGRTQMFEDLTREQDNQQAREDREAERRAFEQRMERERERMAVEHQRRMEEAQRNAAAPKPKFQRNRPRWPMAHQNIQHITPDERARRYEANRQATEARLLAGLPPGFLPDTRPATGHNQPPDNDHWEGLLPVPVDEDNADGGSFYSAEEEGH